MLNDGFVIGNVNTLHMWYTQSQLMRILRLSVSYMYIIFLHYFRDTTWKLDDTKITKSLHFLTKALYANYYELVNVSYLLMLSV